MLALSASSLNPTYRRWAIALSFENGDLTLANNDLTPANNDLSFENGDLTPEIADLNSTINDLSLQNAKAVSLVFSNTRMPPSSPPFSLKSIETLQ